MTTPPPPRLSVIRALRAPRAVVLRRGPSAWTRMLLWDLARDRIEPGQWVRAQPYPDRADLSPDGRFLALPLSDRGRGYTVVCRPPHFSALALHMASDCQMQGAAFDDAGAYHVPDLALCADDSRTVAGAPPRRDTAPDWFTGRDRLGLPGLRLLRAGWVMEEPPRIERRLWTATFSRALPMGWHLHKRVPYGPGETAWLTGPTGRIDLDAEWADAHEGGPEGGIVTARDGRLWRAPLRRDGLGPARALLDLRDMTPEPIPAPYAALNRRSETSAAPWTP